MANISHFEADGVSYSYDTEARNTLGLRTFEKAINGDLVYDKDTKAPTEVVGIPANKLKAVVEEPAGENEQEQEPVPVATKTKTVYFDNGSGDIIVAEVTYTGDINETNAYSVKLNYEYDGSTGNLGGATLQMGSGNPETYPAITPDEGEETPNITDFRIVSAPAYYENYTLSITYENN